MISSGFGGLSAGMILRSFLNAGLEVVELFVDLGDDLLLVPIDPFTDGVFGLTVVDLGTDVGDTLGIASVEVGFGEEVLLVILLPGGVGFVCLWIMWTTFMSSMSSISSVSVFPEMPSFLSQLSSCELGTSDGKL